MTKNEGDCMAFMGRLIPSEVRQYAVDFARENIGLNTGKAYDLVQKMCEQYERDKPYEAQKAPLEYVDLTGHYMMMAAISSAWWQSIGQYEK